MPSPDYYTFTSAPVSIPLVGSANPYPSEIEVDGIDSVIGLTVQINGFSHSWPGDVEVLLEGPKGQYCIVMAISGGGDPSRAVTNINLNFDDSSGNLLPYIFAGDPQLASGTYQPANYRDGEPLWAPPVPPQSENYQSLLSVFNGKDPVGTWRLWVYDIRSPDSGGFDSWSLRFLANSTTSPQTITPDGIPSSEAFGTVVVVNGIRPNGIPSQETFGTPIVSLAISPTGIPSQESFGTLSISNSITPDGIPSSESIGTLSVSLGITPTGIPSAESFGTLYITDAVPHSFTPDGIGSSEVFGTLTLDVFSYIGGIFLYNASHWSSPYFFLEVFAKATSGVVLARLKSSRGIVVPISLVTVSTTNYERFRSPAFVLEDGLTYQVQMGKSGTNAGAWVSAKLINFDGPFGNGAGLGADSPTFVSDIYDP